MGSVNHAHWVDGRLTVVLDGAGGTDCWTWPAVCVAVVEVFCTVD
jgi:hypothetical protein